MNKPKQVVVLCGGLGTRLRPHTDHIPKPMIPCNEKPFLLYLLQQMSDQGLKEFVLLTGYLGENIENYFGDGSQWGWSIQYSNGPIAWDTGKRIWEARLKLDDRFLLLYSDNFVPFSLEKVFALHKKNQTALTFMVSPKHPGNIALFKSGIVEKYDNNRSNNILDFVEIGYMIIEKDKTLDFYKSPECSFSLILEKMVASSEVSAWIQNDNYHSISDPKRWSVTEKYLSLKKIILIDRDGIINKKAQKGEYISSWSEFEWVSDTRAAMKLLAKKGFKFIVVTNQAGIARRMVNLNELDRIHSKMKKELLNDGIEILDIYVCPHHWNEGCDCRKPQPGMFFKASNDWQFRLDQTLFIGDDYRDCQASNNAGCNSVLIGNISEVDKLLDHERPIYVNKRLSDCISNILDFFNLNNNNDNN
jgi:D-glycero-D-manno-heptose 1,7-bisphosphate phosphatase